MLAIAQARTVTIDGAMAKKLYGVRPGVNVPIRNDGQIVGVVGLTGDPPDVTPCAEFVRTIAEMVLEQTHLVQLLERDSRLREELTLSLIREEKPSSSLENWAHHLGLDLSLPRVAVVIGVDGDALQAPDVLNELQRMRTMLMNPGRKSLIAAVSPTELVLLRPALDSLGRWDPERHRRTLEALMERESPDSRLKIRLALGHYYPGPDGLRLSYRTARIVLSVGLRHQPEQNVYSCHAMMLPVLLDGLRDGWQAGELKRPLARLSAHDRDGALRETLRCWFGNDTRSTVTAEALGIHRNTLDYRLGRISEICGMDLDRFENRLHLYIALTLA